MDVINVADGARAQARMGNLALCLRMQEEVGLPALMHLDSRDTLYSDKLPICWPPTKLGVRNLR